MNVTYQILVKTEQNLDHSGADELEHGEVKLSGRHIVLDEIDNENIVDNSEIKTYLVPREVEFDLLMNSKMSKIDATNLKITNLESRLAENRANIRFLESAINYIEGNLLDLC